MTTENNKGRIGSSFERFLEEQGRLQESTAMAIKRVRARHPMDLPDDLRAALDQARVPEWTARCNHELDE